MCLAVPGKILETKKKMAAGLAGCSSAGSRGRFNWISCRRPAVGDYVIVHVGFALSKVNAEEAAAHLSILRRNGNARGGVGDWLRIGIGSQAPGSSDRALADSDN